MKTLELKSFGTLLFLSLLIFLADARGFLEAPKGLVQTAILPVQYLIFSGKRAGEETFSFLTFWRSGEARIKNLELRNMELAATKNEAIRLAKENNELRKQLGVGLLAKNYLLPAPVLGLGRHLEIGVGTNDGVATGQAVVYLDNLIGSIVKTSPKASFVQLVTDPQSKVPVKINKARGIALGQYNSSIVLERITQTESISENDQVVTSGEGGTYASDLVVGWVGKIQAEQADLFKEVGVKPAIDYSQLEMVFVVL